MAASSDARRAFVASQAAALEPYGFLIVGVIAPPFAMVRVERGEGDKLDLEAGVADPDSPLTPDQQERLTAIGFDADGGLSAPLDDPDAAAGIVERVLAEVFGITDESPVDVRHGTTKGERQAEAKLASMRERIVPVLTSVLGVPPDQDTDGDYLADVGGVRVYVAPRAAPERPPVIRVFAITNTELTLTPDLGAFLARLNFQLMFGRFAYDAEHRALWFDETLLGEHVTDEELRFTVAMVAGTAREWDQRLAQMFGGVLPRATPPESVASKPGRGGYL